MEKKQIVMYGGCFNPPLNSHFTLAEQLINEYDQIDKVVFVPVNSKYQKAGLISNIHRYKMLQLVCSENEKMEVSKIELESKRPMYTIETLKELKKIYPNNEIALAIGSDNLKELDLWHKAEELIKNFKIYVISRDKDNIEDIIESHKLLKENKSSFIKAKNNIISNLSSTYVREKLKNNKSIRYLTTDKVIKYIKENNLYI